MYMYALSFDSQSNLFSTGLMGNCWFWDLGVVIDYKLWMPELEKAITEDDLKDRMRDARANAGVINKFGKYVGSRPYEGLFR